jgi:2-polyprenyl-3-methyl-5-hydroxy-6-metoxy-1,4-benzoquinol methylase
MPVHLLRIPTPIQSISENAKNTDFPQWHCPIHRKPLREEGESLVCADGDYFPYRGGIPRFVPQSNYADAFGAQWKRYRLTQLDSYTKSSLSRDRARRCVGEQLWNNLAGKQLLECGCGAGRFTEVLLQRGASVTSIDLSDAVEANQENCPQNDTHRIGQADIQKLPFAPQQFDVVFCLGVVQHTPSTENTIRYLYEQVKPGGTLVIDHYTHNLSWYTKTALPLRYYLRRLSPEEGIKWTEKLVDTFLPLHRLARSFHPAHMLISRLSPVQSYYHALPELDDKLQREWALLDTHDSLTAWYRRVRTRGQLRQTLTQLGLRDIWCEYGGNGVEARGKRPLA